MNPEISLSKERIEDGIHTLNFGTKCPPEPDTVLSVFKLRILANLRPLF